LNNITKQININVKIKDETQQHMILGLCHISFHMRLIFMVHQIFRIHNRRCISKVRLNRIYVKLKIILRLIGRSSLYHWKLYQ
jgi:hypothetical protein